MSRNGPIGYPARPQARRPQADDPFTAPPTGQPQQPHWPPQQYSEPPAQPGQQPGWPPPAYREAPTQHAQAPNYGQQPTYTQPTAYPPQPPAHAPQASYSQPLPSQGQPPPYGAADQQHQQGYYFPQAGADPQAAASYPPQGMGHQLPFGGQASAPPPSQAPTVARRVPQADPQGYDLGSYMPAPTPGFPPAAPDAVHQDPDAAAFQGQRDHYGYGESDDGDLDEILADEEEPPRRGRRGMMIAAALVGAIGLGGALAYTYKSLVAPSGGRAPVIKAADFGPNKVKPETPDGKGFAHTDKKLPNRLGEDGSAPPVRPVAVTPAADATDDPNAPRKVRIIPITPGGPPPAAAPPVTAAVAPPPSAPPMVSVPGVMLDPIRAPQASPSAARVVLPPPSPQAQQQPPVRAVQAPPVKVASAARTVPPPPVAEPAAAPAVRKAAAAASASDPVRSTVPKTPVPKRTETAAAPAASAASGYVAVLSSQKSRMDALKVFADMREKYGDVLGSKTPDVQEANLGDKGIWYRAVVGPPGSRDAASVVCSQLKTAGYTGCWVTAY